MKNLYETSTGWYRHSLQWSLRENERVSLRFEGVYMDCRVYVNGLLAGEWKYGYSTFEFDITELLRDGCNRISLRADYRAPNSRWYSGAGIYRRVWLKTFPDCHLTADGTVNVTSETERPAGTPSTGLSVRHLVYDEGKLIAQTQHSCCAADYSCMPEAVRR